MGIFLPAGTPEPIRARLQGDFLRVVQMKDVHDRLVALGNEVVGAEGAKMEAHIGDELKLYADVIKTAGIKAQ